ncbi:MAG: hypothetical protein RIE08_00320 [Acidimicrobiales bacterium]
MRTAVAAIATRRDLWVTALAVGWRLRRRRWWIRFPFLPVPDSGYLRLRALTAYGDPDAPPVPADVIAWLEWCRDDASR